MEIEMESRTSRLCFDAANTSLFLASESLEPSIKTHHAVCGIVFAAFAFEAMMNHYGRVAIPNWNVQERNGSRLRNHTRILETLNVSALMDSVQYKTLLECNELRDKVAHGKTTDDAVESQIDQSGLEREQLVRAVLAEPSSLEREFTIEKLDTYIDALTELEHMIETATGIAEFPLHNSGIVSWSH